MTESKTQSELEAPAKVYQVEAVSKQIAEFKELYMSNINAFSQTYVTKSEHHAQLQDAIVASEKARAIICTDVKNLSETINSLKKFGYSMMLIVGGLLVNLIWQYITNSGKL